MDKQEYYYPSPIGTLHLIGSENGLCRIEFTDIQPLPAPQADQQHLLECIRQLDLYFKGSLKEFNLKLDLSGTEFQLKVWEQLQKIPFGAVKSYGELAAKVGGKNYMRAVGGANNRNPIAIVVPCHRIIGADGKLVGYAGGIWRKEWLLKHEASILV